MHPLVFLLEDCTAGGAGVLIELIRMEEPRCSARATVVVSCDLINVCEVVRRIPILVRYVNV